jgi:hypothetical protein
LDRDLSRPDLAITLFAPTSPALHAARLPADAAPGGDGAEPGSVLALLREAPASAAPVIAGHAVKGTVNMRGGSYSTLVTSKAVGVADHAVGLTLDGRGGVAAEGGPAKVVRADDGRCPQGGAIVVVDAVLLPFKL